MPISHTRRFRIRYYECDAYGHLNNANYLRLMQETAFDASAAAGYDAGQYKRMGCRWLIRATQIEYLRPVQYDDSVLVRTWIEDFRRASSRRAYEFINEKSGEIAARAFSDWVWLSLETGQPVSIPLELRQAFFPEGIPDQFPKREAFPKPPPPPPGVFAIRLKVNWRDLDMVRHVNNANYLDYVEECGFQVIAAHHWPWTRMAEQGFAILLRQNQIQYFQSALLDDELEISTWASDVRRSTATRHYMIQRVSDGALLAQVNALGVWVDLQTGRPIRIPTELLSDFATNITGN